MKIVELIIDELEDIMGFDAVALVENPAHQANFFAFEEDDIDDAVLYQILKGETFKKLREEFVTKLPGESRDDYLSRCIPKLRDEGYSQDQAAAICYDTFDETEDPQELVIGDYQTRHYDMCPGASTLYRKIESQEIDTDMGIAIRNAKLQDALFYLEKHTIKEMGKASFEDLKVAEILANEIMNLARMMDLEAEHQYIAGHVEAIRNLYLQGQEEGMELDPSTLPDFINEIPEDKKKVEFESYTDYPESATNAARRALEWRDTHPDTDCGTRVGWARANQLANRRPISESTIARMASFARHRQHKDVAYSEGCGGLVWDLWGGTAGIEWAQRKLKEIREEQSSANFSKYKNKFRFTVEEDQQIVVGPLMIPDKLIFRVDENDEPYYVYFTEETIEKIARKMMEEKRLDDVNLEHIQDHIVDGHLIETWIVGDPQKDKQTLYGMDYPKGTWMGMYKVDDEDIWQKVKNGELKGFSIEGYFADRLVQN